MQTVPVSVIIPTFRRTQLLIRTISKIKSCSPAPAEVLVHVDAGDSETEGALRTAHPDVIIIISRARQGPGGGRNRLVEAARNEFVASFDDDSWPMNQRFFKEVHDLLGQYQDVALFACQIIEADEVDPNATISREADNDQFAIEAACFGGGGCFFRRSAFLATGGYVPLLNAYGMEEADVSLKLIDGGQRIGFISTLSVYHDCDRKSRHAHASINAAQIRNVALLAYLRYPINYWPYGAAQVLNRVWYCLRHNRRSGIVSGLFSIPIAFWKNRSFRQLVKPETVQRVCQIRRAPDQIFPVRLK